MFVVRVNTGNSNFDGQQGVERLARMLTEIPDKLIEGCTDDIIEDDDGEPVGHWALLEGDE